MATENDLDKFARLENGVIVEYPVYRMHIVNRSHPFSWYTRVNEIDKPEVPPFHWLKETLKVRDGYIDATYELIPDTLDEILVAIRRKANILPGSGKDISITDVDQATIQRVYVLGGNYVTALLDAFAQTRLYDGIDTLIAKKTSSFEKFKKEADRGQYLFDECWKAIVPYFDKVLAGILPIPKSTKELDALLPKLTWEDEDGVTQ